MTIVEDRPVITGGVDTHADLHVAAALDPLGGLLGVQEFPATATGYAQLLDWLGGFGTIAVVGVEGTGSYGAGLTRHLAAVQRVIHRAMAAAALRLQRQLRGHVHPVLLAQHRVAHLEQRVPALAQAQVQLPAEPGSPARA